MSGRPATSVFVWVRTRGALTPVQPVVLRDPSVGPVLEIVSQYPMLAHHYCLSLDELSEIYPAPEVNPDS